MAASCALQRGLERQHRVLQHRLDTDCMNMARTGILNDLISLFDDREHAGPLQTSVPCLADTPDVHQQSCPLTVQA